MTATRPSHDAIARRAYELYLERRGYGGDPQHDWLRAEAELSAELMEAAPRPVEPAPAPKPAARRRPAKAGDGPVKQAAPRKPRAPKAPATPKAKSAAKPRTRSPRR